MTFCVALLLGFSVHTQWCKERQYYNMYDPFIGVTCDCVNGEFKNCKEVK